MEHPPHLRNFGLIALAAFLVVPAFSGCLGGETSPTPAAPTPTTSPTPTATPPAATPPPAPEPLNLKLGIMMPLTGGLNSLGPDMRDGALLAVKELNEANLGIKIEYFIEDDKTTDSTAAPNTFNRLLAKGVTAIVGPCCSGVTGAILDLAKQNEVVVASPSATSPKLTLERENGGFFWRIAPSDAVQGKVLANLVHGDGAKNVNMIVVNNAYGNGLAGVFKQQFESKGGKVGVIAKHDEGATTFASQVDQVATTGTPDAIVLVVYIDEGAAIMKEMFSKGHTSKFKFYGSEGIYNTGFVEKAGKDEAGNWITAGMKGTSPAAVDLTKYNAMFNATYKHDPSLYSAESYDGVMYVALAALKAGSVKGADIAKQLRNVANAPGDKVSDAKTAGAAIKAGKDVDYVGQAHDFTFDERHEPTTGFYDIWKVTADGKLETTQKNVSA